MLPLMEAMSPREYDVMAAVEGEHWWYRTLRRLVVLELKDRDLGPGAAVVDVGCGTGGTLKELRRCFPDIGYIGIDVDPQALEYCQRFSPTNLIRASADSLPLKSGCADAVLCLDSLYFKTISTKAALLQCFDILLPGRILIVNLPAFACLAGRHDQAVGIPRRYRLGDVRALVEEAGFEVVRSTYWNMMLFLPMLAWRIASKYIKSSELVSDLERTPRWINPLLEAILGVEVWLARWGAIPFGSSVFLVARKPG